MGTYYILKPVRESLFLDSGDVRDLPLAHLMNLVVTFVAVNVYATLARRLSRPHFVVLVNITFIGCMVAFWSILAGAGVSVEVKRRLAWVYYAFVSAFSVFSVTLLWSLTHASFTPAEGRRYYGMIGSGGTLGAFLGGYLTHRYAVAIGTENLLLVASGVFLPCLALGWLMGTREVSATQSESQVSAKTPKEIPQSASVLGLLRNNPYLAGIATLVFLKLFVAVTKDYQIQKIIEVSFQNNKDGMTEFFGGVYQWTNLLGLFLGLVVTGPLQSRFGALPGLLTYPLAALATAIGLIFWPNLSTVFWMVVVSQACAYSIFQWSQELLYQRTSEEEKFVAKGFIDTLVFRFGSGASAMMLLGIGYLFQSSPQVADRWVMGILIGASLGLSVVVTILGIRFNQMGRSDSNEASA